MTMRGFNRLPVLIADDDTDDCLIAMEAWEETGLGSDLKFVQDGDELMDYLYHRGRFTPHETSPMPGIILLDLKMPKKKWVGNFIGNQSRSLSSAYSRRGLKYIKCSQRNFRCLFPGSV